MCDRRVESKASQWNGFFIASEIMIKYVKMNFAYGEQIYYTGVEPVGFLCLHIVYVIY